LALKTDIAVSIILLEAFSGAITVYSARFNNTR